MMLILLQSDAASSISSRLALTSCSRRLCLLTVYLIDTPERLVNMRAAMFIACSSWKSNFAA